MRHRTDSDQRYSLDWRTENKLRVNKALLAGSPLAVEKILSPPGEMKGKWQKQKAPALSVHRPELWRAVESKSPPTPNSNIPSD